MVKDGEDVGQGFTTAGRPQPLRKASTAPVEYHGPVARCEHLQDGMDCSLLRADIDVFGIFQNPPGFEPQVGFYDGASTRVLEVSLLRDVGMAADGAPAFGAEMRR